MKIDCKIDFLRLPKIDLCKNIVVLLCFSLQLAQEYESGDQSVVGHCQCKGEYLETHGFGTGTWFYFKKCKEGWYDYRPDSVSIGITTCCKENSKKETTPDPTEFMIGDNY